MNPGDKSRIIVLDLTTNAVVQIIVTSSGVSVTKQFVEVQQSTGELYVVLYYSFTSTNLKVMRFDRAAGLYYTQTWDKTIQFGGQVFRPFAIL